MAESPDDVASRLCSAFAVRPDGPDRWVVRTPLLYDDGDALPVVIRRVDGEWELTDDGMTVSHLYFDEFEYTEARVKRIESVAERFGGEMAESHRVVVPLDGPPTEFDVGLFLQLVAQVQGVALLSNVERDEVRYVTSIRTRVEHGLATPDSKRNWSPEGMGSHKTKARYRADLWVAANDTPGVALFVASTSDKANVAALTVDRFQKSSWNGVPLLAYHPDRVTSEAVYRFQDQAGADAAVIQARPGEDYAILQELRRRGVAVGSS